MCNFHINDNWELGAGIYGAYLVDENYKDMGGNVSVSVAGMTIDANLDADYEPKKVDFGAYAVAKYNFENGLFVGLDYSYGFNDVAKYIPGKNMTFGALVGFRF